MLGIIEKNSLDDYFRGVSSSINSSKDEYIFFIFYAETPSDYISLSVGSYN